MIFHPPSIHRREQVTAEEGTIEFVQHDLLIGFFLLIVWSFGFWFWAFWEHFDTDFSVGRSVMVFGSPLAVLGIWKTTYRRVFRFHPSKGVLEIEGFSLMRGGWSESHRYQDTKLRTMKRYVGRGGFRYFVMLRGPTFDVSLHEAPTQEVADQKRMSFAEIL